MSNRPKSGYRAPAHKHRTEYGQRMASKWAIEDEFEPAAAIMFVEGMISWADMKRHGFRNKKIWLANGHDLQKSDWCKDGPVVIPSHPVYQNLTQLLHNIKRRYGWGLSFRGLE